MNRSTQSGSSPIAAPASRATPSQPKPPRAGPGSRSCPLSSLPTPPGCDLVEVETAEQMRGRDDGRSCRPRRDRDGAAVADFRPKVAATGKIKKETACPRSCSSRRPTSSPGWGPPSVRDRCWSGSPPRPSDLIANATAKLQRKRLDLIVANDVGAPRVGFRTTPTRSRCCGRGPSVACRDRPRTKRDVARAVLDTISRHSRLPIRSPHIDRSFA